MAERKRLQPGIYEVGDELHVDLEEFVAAAGGDPTSDADREKAIVAIQEALARNDRGIPIEVQLK